MDQPWLTQLPLTNIIKVTSVSGGDVNKAYRLETADRPYFLLVQPNRRQDFFTAEIAGLAELAKASITVPEVIGRGEINGDAYLLLEFLKQGQGRSHDLALLVAKMHRRHSENGLFGFDYDYQGAAITFDNSWTASWSELFVNRRLDHLRDSIMAQQLWPASQDTAFQEVRKIIVNALARHDSEPSLLHGDLWGGNHMFLADGRPVLYDPAVLYGDREFDIGISTVFGGFDAEFYETYQQAYPLSAGSSLRINFYRLYILMVHLLKFGNIYAAGVNRTMKDILQS